jgi:glutathione S-transferase
MELIIGTKRLSSWSLRAWLPLKRTGHPFTETEVVLFEDRRQPEILRHSPSGYVPALKDGDLLIADSLAICEYLSDRFPQAKLWPQDIAARALARAAAAEMHSGFAALRKEHGMDLTVRTIKAPSDAAAADVRRIVELWRAMLDRFGGPWLAGGWSIADAFYAPVATRFRSYGIDLAAHGDDGSAQAYAGRLLDTPEFKQWESEALAEPA